MTDVKKNTGHLKARRKFIKGTAAAATAASIGPWIISSKVLASSGEVNVMMWSDYLTPGFLKSFEADTGIKVNYTGIGSNEEIINKMKASKGRGFDICSRVLHSGLNWACYNHLIIIVLKTLKM